MNKIGLHVKIQLKNGVRSRAVFLAGAILWLYCSMIYIQTLPEKEPLFMIQNGYYGQAVSMLAFMYAGVVLAQYERKHQVALVFVPDIAYRAEMCLSKILLLLLAACLFVFAVYLSNCAAYAILGMNWTMHLYAAKMFVSYYLLPVMISGVIGLAIGAQCVSRMKYMVVLVVWLFLNPLSLEITAYIQEALGSNLKRGEYVFSMISAGARMQTGPTPVYGIPFSTYKTMLLAGKLCAAILYCIAACILAGSKRGVRGMFNAGMVAAMIGIPVLCYSNDSYKTMVYSSIPEVKRANYEFQYYSGFYDRAGMLDANALAQWDAEKKIKASRCRVALQTTLEGMNVICEYTCVPMEDLTGQVFTLYRDFDVESILINGEPAEYTRTGDYVRVQFPGGIRKGSEFSVEWTYSGTSSPIFCANSDTVYLSACFPWLPEPGMRMPLPYSWSVETNTYVLYAGHTCSDPVEYELTYSSPYTTYVNLDRVDAGRWKGISTDGLTIFSDMLMQYKEIDGISAYYPASLDRSMEDILTIALYVNRIQADMLGTVGAMGGNVQRFVIPPVTPTLEMDGVIRNYTMHGDLMLCFETPFFIHGYVNRYTKTELQELKGRSAPDRMAAEDAIDAIRNQPAFIEAAAYDPVNRVLGEYLLAHYLYQNGLTAPDEWEKTWRNRMQRIQRTAGQEISHWEEIVGRIESRLKQNMEGEDAVLTQWFGRIMRREKTDSEDVFQMLIREETAA